MVERVSVPILPHSREIAVNTADAHLIDQNGETKSTRFVGHTRLVPSPGGDCYTICRLRQRSAFAASFTRVRTTVSSALAAIASQVMADRSCITRRLVRLVLAAASRSAAACPRSVSTK